VTTKRRGRAARREQAREHEQLVRDLQRLAALEPGGTPQHPIVVDSPAVIEPRATAAPCPLCDGPLKLDAHTAEVIGGVRLRVAAVACTLCGTGRSIFFRLDEPLVH
jgi:hypothetical protein